MAVKGGELNIPHIQRLIDVAVAQVQFAVTDVLRHSQAHLGVEPDHPSLGVILKEVLAKAHATLDEYFPTEPVAQEVRRPSQSAPIKEPEPPEAA